MLPKGLEVEVVESRFGLWRYAWESVASLGVVIAVAGDVGVVAIGPGDCMLLWAPRRLA